MFAYLTIITICLARFDLSKNSKSVEHKKNSRTHAHQKKNKIFITNSMHAFRYYGQSYNLHFFWIFVIFHSQYELNMWTFFLFFSSMPHTLYFPIAANNYILEYNRKEQMDTDTARSQMTKRLSFPLGTFGLGDFCYYKSSFGPFRL